MGHCYAADSDWLAVWLWAACGSPVSALILDTHTHTHTEALAPLCVNGSCNPATRKRNTVASEADNKHVPSWKIQAFCFSVSSLAIARTVRKEDRVLPGA